VKSFRQILIFHLTGLTLFWLKISFNYLPFLWSRYFIINRLKIRKKFRTESFISILIERSNSILFIVKKVKTLVFRLLKLFLKIYGLITSLKIIDNYFRRAFNSLSILRRLWDLRTLYGFIILNKTFIILTTREWEI